jgi:hypothetical protein
VPPVAAPAKPDVRPDELRLGSPFALAEGVSYTIGWQRWPDDAGGPGFALLRRGRLGTLKVIQRYPFTDEGWSQAWEGLAARDGVTASAVSKVLAQRAAALGAGALPGRFSGVPAPGSPVSAPASRRSAQASPTSAPGSQQPAPGGQHRPRAGRFWPGAYLRGRQAGRDPINVIIAASLACGVLGTVFGAAGALALTLTFWSLAGAPYAVALLALLGCLPLAGVRALVRRRKAAPAPSQQAASPP